MKNEKFNSLIVDAYKKYKEEGNLSGILYSAVSTYGFSQITDINGLVESSPADMLHLKSLLTDTEINIYEYDLVDYKINNSRNMIYIRMRNSETALMY
jgi:hypothetical protein